MAGNADTLPYRTTGEDLERFVSARNRGRDMSQIRSLFTSSPNFRGTLSAAEVLKFYDPEAEHLTQLGRDFASEDDDEKKKALFSAILAYEAYELLLEAIFTSGISEDNGTEFTSLEWIESWWEDNEYGSSETNRTEGSTAFAKIISYLSLGTYKQGRHGHPSRIEWSSDVESRVQQARSRSREESPTQSNKEVRDEEPSDRTEQQPVSDAENGHPQLDSKSENNVLTLNLSNNRVAKLSLPPKLTPKEKERLVSLVDLMVATDDDEASAQMEMKFQNSG